MYLNVSSTLFIRVHNNQGPEPGWEEHFGNLEMYTMLCGSMKKLCL